MSQLQDIISSMDMIVAKLREIHNEAGNLGKEDFSKLIELFSKVQGIARQVPVAGGPTEFLNLWKEVAKFISLSVEETVRLGEAIRRIAQEGVLKKRFQGMSVLEVRNWTGVTAEQAQAAARNKAGQFVPAGSRAAMEGEAYRNLRLAIEQEANETRLAGIMKVLDREQILISLRKVAETEVAEFRQRRGMFTTGQPQPTSVEGMVYNLRYGVQEQESIRATEATYNELLTSTREREEAEKNIALSEADQLEIINRLQRLQQVVLQPGRGLEIPITSPDLTAAQRREEALAEARAQAQAVLQTPGRAAELRIGGGDIAVRNVIARIGELRYNITDLDKVTTESSTGITKWLFTIRDGANVVQHATLATDKYGTVLQDMSTRFRNFWSAIGRDIIKVAQWGISAALVYAPIRKLNELIKESIEIQTKLADVQVALAQSTTSINTVFETSAQIAREYGTSVVGVIDGYLLAYRAAGGYESSAQRSAVATQLLSDSMMLAKLSGMSQAQALDHLTATLRQLGMPLTDGIALLDKWVAVTKIANVDLNTLAEGFAIMGGAAEGVGVDIDKLNALIAAFAEASQYSGTEVANALRGFVAGFQSGQVEESISRYGIAISDANGNMRDFTEVFDEISQKFQQGLITEQQLSDIANVMGGGWRRGAQLMALIKNWSRVAEIYAVSVNASGDAEAALAIRMDTVATALTNLKNAFSELARHLGQEGGFLDLIQGGVEVLTFLVDGITSLVRVLGRAIPVLIAFGVAWKLAVSPQGQMFFGGGGTTGFLGMAQRQGLAGTLGRATTGAGGMVGGLWETITSSMGGRMGLGAALGGIGTAISSAGQQNAGWKIGTSIAASAIGTMLTGSPQVGMIIGQLAAQLFIQDAKAGIGDLGPAFAAIFAGPEVQHLPTEEEARQQARDIVLNISPVMGTLFNINESKARRSFEERFNMVPGAASGEQVQSWQTLAALKYLAGRTSFADTLDVLDASMMILLTHFRDLNPEVAEAAAAFIDVANAAQQTAEQQIEGSPFYQAILNLRPTATPVIQGIVTREQRERFEQYSRGQITGKELDTFNENARLATLTVTELYAALGDSGEAVLGVDSARDAIAELTDIVLSSSDEELMRLTRLREAVDDAAKAFLEETSAANLATLATARQTLAEDIAARKHAQAYREYEIPGIHYVAPGTTTEQITAITTEARRRTVAEAMAQTLNPDEQQRILDQFGPFAILLGDTLSNAVAEGFTFEGIDPAKFDEVAEEMQAAFDRNPINFNIEEINPQEFAALPSQQMIDRMTAWLQAKFPQWQPNPVDVGYVDAVNHQTQIVHGDQLVVAMLMRDLIDINEKQLEGVFNLPADMAALVPMTGQLYFSTSPIAQGGGAGIGDWMDVIGGLEGAATALSSAADDLHYVPATATTMYPRGPATYPWANEPESYTTPEEEAAAAVYRFASQLNWFRAEHGIGAENQEPPIPAEPERRGGPTTAPAGAGWAGMGILDKWLERIMKASGILQGGGPTTAPGGAGWGGMMYSPRPANLKPLEDMMPQSIPITTKITLNNQNIVYVDGQKILDALLKREQVDFKNAKRRTGTVAYDVSY